MKTRSCGALGAATFATAASMFVTSAATAEVLGLMATSRPQSNGNYLVNFFAVASAATDVLLSVSGGQTGSITTNAAGGFRQSTGPQSLFGPAGSQSWTTLDSFLTVGGGLDTSIGLWTANGSTAGDPNWNVSYTDTDSGESTSVNAFNTASNETGFTNPYTTVIAPAGGWFLGGASSPARSLASLYLLTPDMRRYSNDAARNGAFGMMIAQFCVSGWHPSGGGDPVISVIDLRNMRVSFNTGDIFVPSFRIVVPAPGALALLGIARLAGGRRRLA